MGLNTSNDKKNMAAPIIKMYTSLGDTEQHLQALEAAFIDFPSLQ